MAICVRKYCDGDARAVGILIADTYAEFNLGFATESELPKLLGPFRNARSDDPAHQAAVVAILRAEWVLVATDGDTIVGALRGKPGRLHSLFVHESHHRQGIATRLVAEFEALCRAHGTGQITLAASIYAVPFYQAIGYRRSTGVRVGNSFEGSGMPFQPMKKVLTSQVVGR